MKFDWKLSRFENLQRFERSYRLNNSKANDYSILGDFDKSRLCYLGARLLDLERKIYPGLVDRYRQLQNRVADPSDWLTDFNMNIAFCFYLSESDDEYEEGDDNVIAEFSDVFDPECCWGFGCHDVNYIEPEVIFGGEYHCYSYHQLYAHQYLSWGDLLRIGGFEFELTVDEQSYERLPYLSTV